MAAKPEHRTVSQSKRKLALVIGIGEYEHYDQLSNPKNDAEDMSSKLKEIGFIITVALHLKRVEMKRILVDFEESIQPGDMVLFYFAGHGTQWEDQNYLLPKDIPDESSVNLNRSAINAQDILNTLSDRNPFVIIFLLDCCRTYHLRNKDLDARGPDSNDSNSFDFKPMQKAGSLIAFACAPGTKAIEGKGQRNGLFTKHLLEHIKTPNKDIQLILRTVRREVVIDSNSRQIPFLSDGLLEQNIYLWEQPQNETPLDFIQISDADLKLHEEIGHGGFGTVYRATWLTRRMTVAMKKLHLTTMTDKLKKEFVKELTVMQRIRSPNIITFYGACTETGKYALVMEYMSLGSLYTMLHENDTQFAWSERLSIAFQAASGINYLHQLSEPILHRDIKSANFLLEKAHEAYIVKVCDFGVAKTRNETTRRTASTVRLVYTLPWTAPEILCAEDYTDKSDIYSLGIVYWELATCKIPYEGLSDDVIRAFVLAKDRLKIPQSTPSMFRILIDQCWSQNPNERPNSFHLVEMIEECIQVQDEEKLRKTKSKDIPKELPQSKLKPILDAQTPSSKPSTPSRVPTYVPQLRSVVPNIPQNARWSQKGTTVAGGNGRGNATNQLYNPYGLFVDDDQTVIIADYYNNHIIQWKKNDTNGQVIAGGNGQGNRLDQLNSPTDVLIDKETDTLIIADRWNRRVMRWSRLMGTTQGEILIDNIRCYGLALDDQRYLYVSDTEKHEVRRYKLGDNKNGTVVAGGNGVGVGLNQLNIPTYLFVDQQQNVYVSDRDNNRVMKWTKNAKEGIVVAGGNGKGSALTQLSYPNGLFVDNLGTLYIADLGNHRVLRWPQGATQGTVIVGGNGAGAGENQFNYLRGLSFDRHGILYVVDYNNARVQRFAIE